MYKKYPLLTTLLLLSSCIYNPDGYLKRSASNKLIDARGFQKEKRLPLYNKKYIDRAKKNIIEHNYEEGNDDDDGDDDSDETYNPAELNKDTYRKMIKTEQKNADVKPNAKRTTLKTKKLKYSQEFKNSQLSDYPKISEIQIKIDEHKEDIHKQELQRQIEEMKSTLTEMRKQLHKKSHVAPSKTYIANDNANTNPKIRNTEGNISTIDTQSKCVKGDHSTNLLNLIPKNEISYKK